MVLSSIIKAWYIKNDNYRLISKKLFFIAICKLFMLSIQCLLLSNGFNAIFLILSKYVFCLFDCKLQNSLYINSSLYKDLLYSLSFKLIDILIPLCILLFTTILLLYSSYFKTILLSFSFIIILLYSSNSHLYTLSHFKTIDFLYLLHSYYNIIINIVKIIHFWF